MTHTTRAGHRRRGLRPIAAIAALALVVAACGGDDDDEPAADEPTEEPADEPADEPTEEPADEPTEEPADEPTEEPADEPTEEPADEPASKDPVKIGVLSDETGPSQTRLITVAQATADAINAEGGLNGHPIELVHTDLGSDVTKAQAAVADLPDDVIAVLLGTSATEAAIADLLNERGVPVLGIGYNPYVWGGAISVFGLDCSVSPDYCSRSNFFATTSTIEQSIAQQLIGASASGATNVTSAYCVEVDSCAAAAPIFEAIGVGLGLNILPAVPISAAAPDYSAECVSFIQDDIEFVQVSASAAAAVNLAASCQDQGWEGTFGASAGSVDSQILGIPAPFAGGLNAFPWFVDDPLVVEYRDIVEGAGVPEKDWAYSGGTSAYSNLRLLQAAINDYADPDAPLDGAAALAAMYSLDGEDLGGLLPNPVSYSPDDLNRTVPCFWLYTKDADGNIENPNGGLTTACFPEG